MQIQDCTVLISGANPDRVLDHRMSFVDTNITRGTEMHKPRHKAIADRALSAAQAAHLAAH